MFKALMLLSSFALTAFSFNDPITSLPEGSYLGEGVVVTTTGATASYASFASFESDTMSLMVVRDGSLFSYSLDFTFSSNGFFIVDATENVNGVITNHFGEGYCRSIQCHFNFETDTRIVEETLTFANWENKIYAIGSMRYVDENGLPQTMSWEERLLLVTEKTDEE
jgi:hypothetical protein